MDIINFITQKVKDFGIARVSEVLQVQPGYVNNYVKKESTPGYKICQRCVDWWMEDFQKINETYNRVYLDENKNEFWNGRDVCILVPSYKYVNPDTFWCTMALWDGSKMRVEFKRGESMIARSRNQLAKRFLDSGCTWSLWIDDDIIFPFGPQKSEKDFDTKRMNAAGVFRKITGMNNLPDEYAGVNPIERMVSWGKTIIGGCYWDRYGCDSVMCGLDGGWKFKPPFNTLHPVTFCGTGFVLVHRQVYLDIAKKFPETMMEKVTANDCAFFSTLIAEDGRMRGEDESFGLRAAQAGHPSYLDLGIVCGHVGYKTFGIPNK
jgi:hypothetical protein